MNLRRLRAVVVKEVRYILRDRATLFLVLFTPTFLLVLLAYSVTADVDHVPVAVYDGDRSPTSRALLQRLEIGDELDLIVQVQRLDALEELLLWERAHVALVIPRGFERQLLSQRGVPLQVIVDGTEPQTGNFALEVISRRAEAMVIEALAPRLRAQGLDTAALEPVRLQVRAWYNPNLKAKVDMIPGLLSLVMAVPGLSVALTLAREREHGTLEQLLATPVGRGELLLGKIGPYVISGMFNVLLTTAVAVFWFGVPVHGDFGLYLALSALFFFALLSLGMIVGVFLRTQAAAMALSFLVMFFPGFFLTGIFFPLVSMPQIARLEGLALPGTHYAFITRSLFITGAGLDVLWPYALGLLLLGTVFISVAALFFQKRLA